MDKAKTLLELLETCGDFVSGSELADRLGVTRASVWKYTKTLQQEGYDIEAVTNRGYRLSAASDVITETEVRKGLGALSDRFSIEVRESCASTNLVLKERAVQLPEWYTVIAGTQTAGRGRLGRSFHSPEGTGLYMSTLLHPGLSAADTTMVTTAAAVAVCRAVEVLAPVRPEIKWVNDVLIGGKKICGILTEANFDMESGTIDSVVLGIGINVTEPRQGFPEELKDIAGAVFPKPQRNMRSRLAAEVLRAFYQIYRAFPDKSYVAEYRQRSMLPGRLVSVLFRDGAKAAVAQEIDDDCRLVVRYEDGSCETLSAGEVSVRPGKI